MDSWFLSAVKGAPGNEKKASKDPMRRLCLRKLKNIPAQTTCILLIILQACLLNVHLAAAFKNPLMWLWFVADAAVVVVFIATFYLKEWRLGHVRVKHRNEHEFAKGLPYAPAAWFVYAAFLGARVCSIFAFDLENKIQILDLKSCICGTALICIFFTWGHHHHQESLTRRASILSLVKLFTIDVLDTVDILDVLFNMSEHHTTSFPKALEPIILATVTLNLIRPSVSLLSLFGDHFTSHINSLKLKILKSLYELLLLNIPLLTIRLYLAVHYDEPASVFLVKNIVGILFGVVEIYDCTYDIYSEAYNSIKLSEVNDKNSMNNNHEELKTEKQNEIEE
ncbi:uncharacterized protein [Watersipora subatra]|uniref:uncharacterized protein n=1 Tax=Watersipora subatra TaxID=2589382 RepID=UPI00355BE7A1